MRFFYFYFSVFL